MNVIKAGAYEGVSFPYFGKFVARIDMARAKELVRMQPYKIANKQIADETA